MTLEAFTINATEYQSYDTVEEADNYFALDDEHAWNALTDDEKKVLLIGSTRRIDLQRFKGTKETEDQITKFPRSPYGLPYDVELATILLANILHTDSTQGLRAVTNPYVQRIRAGSVEVYFFKSNDLDLLSEEQAILDPTIRALLKPYLAETEIVDNSVVTGEAFGTDGESYFSVPGLYRYPRGVR